MALNLKYAVLSKNAGLDAKITTALGSNALLRFYTGTQPTNPDTALSGNTLVASLACSATFAAGASGGVLTASAIANDSSADNTGTITWGSLLTSGATRKIDFTVGTSGTDMIIDNTSVNAGQVVSCSSLTFTSAN
jgi:hypothetical protein